MNREQLVMKNEEIIANNDGSVRQFLSLDYSFFIINYSLNGGRE